MKLWIARTKGGFKKGYLAISVVKIWELLKLDVLWNKFRNIKLP